MLATEATRALAQLLAGLELPPEKRLNNELAQRNYCWRVRDLGTGCSIPTLPSLPKRAADFAVQHP